MLLFITGIIFIIVGCLFHKFPEKEINGVMGFRTKLSMKNQKNWDFAQKYGFKKMMQLGWIGLIIGIFLFVSGTWKIGSVMWIEMILLFVGFTLLIAKVEKEIKRQEDNSLSYVEFDNGSQYVQQHDQNRLLVIFFTIFILFIVGLGIISVVLTR